MPQTVKFYVLLLLYRTQDINALNVLENTGSAKRDPD